MSASVELTRSELDGIAQVMSQAGTTPAGPLTSSLIAGGRSNLTFRITDERSAWVMRTPPRTGRTPSAHDVIREYRVMKALNGTAVPVAPTVASYEQEDLLGGPFVICGYVEGRTLQTAGQLDELTDSQVSSAVTSLAEALAKLHAVDHVGVGLETFGRPDGYAARQLRRWGGQWEMVGQHFDEEVKHLAAGLISRLERNLPVQRSVGIVHGDYRIDNTLLRIADGNDSAVEVAAIVDWELSTIGDPVADFAMMAVYRHPAFDLVIGEPCAWTSARLPDATGLVAAYEKAGGVELVDLERHLALAHLKLAVIAAGIDHRYRLGAATGAGFDTAGRAVAPLLAAGIDWVAAARG